MQIVKLSNQVYEAEWTAIDTGQGTCRSITVRKSDHNDITSVK